MKIRKKVAVSYTHLNTVCSSNKRPIRFISIPSGFSEGMPIAINLMGRLFEEQTVLNVAYALEQALGFENQYSREG